MTQCLIVVGLALAQALLGVGLGWWLKERRVVLPLTTEDEQASQLLDHLEQLTRCVGDDVEEHSSRMDAISEELTELGPSLQPAGEQVLGLIKRIAKANCTLQGKLATAREQIKEQAEQLTVHVTQARVDPLTELANRRAFADELNRRYAELKRARHPFSLLVADIDHFKEFNDKHGHAIGDFVLRSVAAALKSTMREMDLVARHGGEEFAIILPATELESAALAAERVRKVVEATRWESEGTLLEARVSVGVSQARDNDGPGALFGRADAALYAAKEGGRNCSYVHDGRRCLPVGEMTNLVEAGQPDSSELETAAT